MMGERRYAAPACYVRGKNLAGVCSVQVSQVQVSIVDCKLQTCNFEEADAKTLIASERQLSKHSSQTAGH
jgi:hypothetical protein